MTYNVYGRSLAEVIVAVAFVSFLIGFVAVLCVGNYYRAKKAMERQRQKRLARLSGNAGNGVVGLERSSPMSSNHSTASTQFNEEHQHLMVENWNGSSGPARRRPNEEELLFDVGNSGPRPLLASI